MSIDAKRKVPAPTEAPAMTAFRIRLFLASTDEVSSRSNCSELMDATGRMFYSKSVLNSNIEVNMKDLSAGFYLLKITNNEGGIAVKEIVKQ